MDNFHSHATGYYQVTSFSHNGIVLLLHCKLISFPIHHLFLSEATIPWKYHLLLSPLELERALHLRALSFIGLRIGLGLFKILLRASGAFEICNESLCYG